ncbi:MAG: Stp1/IreP family PP2C-type Ser/Thr phosphatase [Proteobacteria bacterium]|nr:Stp1/IreP family PP2C-type Ser/Thr phosphatase [Pseudomonadota bacterium]
MKARSFAITDIGMKRKVNQDAFLKDDDLGIFLVADGMGGHRGGEVASQLAVQIIRDFCVEHRSLPASERINQAINAACEQIFLKAAQNEDLHGMGTTILALLIENGEASLGQVGDSRGYLMSEGKIWQITEDHSLLNEELRSGRLAASQAKDYQFKNVITRSVGYESRVAVDVYRRVLRSGDIFLLCTDGLSGLVSIEEIEKELSKNNMQQGLQNLIDLANSRGGDDNITALACEVK